MSADAVSLTGVTKRFGATRALDGLSATVASGETVALWGPNGAGKTTLLRCLLGVLPYEGTIRVFGLDAHRHGKAARRLMGYVPQEQSLQAEQTVGETLRFFARVRGVQAAALPPLLASWQLTELVSQPVQALSGGMKQRVALAIALLGDPPLLLLDEPTSHFDARTRQTFAAHLETLKQAGKTLIFCSHRVSEVRRLADRVLVLDVGRLTAAGTPQAVAGALQDGTVLGLTVRAGQEAQAEALLSQRGVALERDGAQLWVAGPSTRHAEALRALAEARIDVIDIELAPATVLRTGAS